jgi:hypothetical protein
VGVRAHRPGVRKLGVRVSATSVRMILRRHRLGVGAENYIPPGDLGVLVAAWTTASLDRDLVDLRRRTAGLEAADTGRDGVASPAMAGDELRPALAKWSACRGQLDTNTTPPTSQTRAAGATALPVIRPRRHHLGVLLAPTVGTSPQLQDPAGARDRDEQHTAGRGQEQGDPERELSVEA